MGVGKGGKGKGSKVWAGEGKWEMGVGGRVCKSTRGMNGGRGGLKKGERR